MITFSVSAPNYSCEIEITAENFPNFDVIIDSIVANAKMQLLSHIFHNHPGVYYSASPEPNTEKLMTTL